MSKVIDPTEGPTTELERIQWALKARFEIQQTLFSLYKFLQKKPDILNDEKHRQIFELLVGAAFSLWRAVFLAETDRDWASMSKGLENFLFRVVTDNTITYQDDKNNNAWTVGYYLDNANMRLERATEKVRELSVAQPEILAFSRAWNETRTYIVFKWEMLHFTLGSLFKAINPDFVVRMNLTITPVDE